MEDFIYDVDDIINHIRSNCIELLNKKYSKQQLLSNGIMKVKSIITGNLTKQNIVDISAIGIAVLLSK